MSSVCPQQLAALFATHIMELWNRDMDYACELLMDTLRASELHALMTNLSCGIELGPTVGHLSTLCRLHYVGCDEQECICDCHEGVR